VDLYSA